MSELVLVKGPIPVPDIVNVAPSNVSSASPLRVELPTPVSTLLFASLLIVIVPAVNAANDEDTELKSVRAKSAKDGESDVCNPKSTAVAATPFVIKATWP